MAEFSKQYCETHDMGFEGDFDILDIFHELEPGNYTSYICEGYGFVAIGKTSDENCVLAMPIDDQPYNTIKWVNYEEVVK